MVLSPTKSKKHPPSPSQLVADVVGFYCCRGASFFALLAGFFSFLSPISSNPT
jgi:hypothetical protein